MYPVVSRTVIDGGAFIGEFTVYDKMAFVKVLLYLRGSSMEMQPLFHKIYENWWISENFLSQNCSDLEAPLPADSRNCVSCFTVVNVDLHCSLSSGHQSFTYESHHTKSSVSY